MHNGVKVNVEHPKYIKLMFNGIQRKSRLLSLYTTRSLNF